MLNLLSNLSLRIKMPMMVAGGLLIVLVPLVLLSSNAIRATRDAALQERLLLAQMAAQHMDETLQHAVRMLENTALLPAVDLADGDPAPEREVLANAYQQLGVFSYGLYFLDGEGNLITAEPKGFGNELRPDLAAWPQVRQTMGTGNTLTSGVVCGIVSQPVVCITTPVRDGQGNITGLLGGTIDLANPGLAGLLQPVQLGETGYAQIVDQSGAVISTAGAGELSESADHQARFVTLINEKKATVRTCHSCHEADSALPDRRDIVAFAPLSTAPWGVAIRQSEDEVFAAASQLQQELVLWVSISLLAAVLFTWWLTRKVVGPVGTLAEAAESISTGDLHRPVRVEGGDEIGHLGQSFELMRRRLQASLHEIQDWNQELEKRVQQRTIELEESRGNIELLLQEVQHKERTLSKLLRKVINAQEEERRRIARELHDETSQFLTALTVNLEALAQACNGGDESKRRLRELKSQVADTLENVHGLIANLRSDYLEDLGLIGALQWYAQSRLSVLGIDFDLEVRGPKPVLPDQVQTALFRISQEAITNVVKHAEADSVRVTLTFEDEAVTVEIADDGRGFDASRVMVNDHCSPRFGLAGIRERIDMLEGSLTIESGPVGGTRLRAEVPLKASRVELGAVDG